MAKMNWERAAARDKERASLPEPKVYPGRPAPKIPFAQVYAKYANKQRAAGRIPLTPVAFLEMRRNGGGWRR